MDDHNKNYYCFTFPIVLDEIKLAHLYELGFESFEEKESSTDGYISESLVNEVLKKEIISIAPFEKATCIQQQNWNEIWESGFHPISVEGKIFIRATFHSPAEYPIEIIIDPKMAFGTGHHATTYMCLSEMMKLDFKNADVLDYGCGSGILAIAAEKLGAKNIDAIDYDIWSVENTEENAILNTCSKIKVYKDDSLANWNKTYDIILANITRDILTANTEYVLKNLRPGGIAIYSGFIPNDVFVLKDKLKELGIKQMKLTMKDDWACLVWTK